jgi:hypothetical protein
MARKPGINAFEPARVVHEYSRTETLELAERWLAIYAANGFGTASRQYLWHVFCAGRTPALEGDQALARYEVQASPQYIALANDRKRAFLTDTRPVRSRMEDWFVFPPNFAWTMAFTHEDGWIGPFFSTHPDHDRLEAENRALLRKQHEIEQARERGWT